MVRRLAKKQVFTFHFSLTTWVEYLFCTSMVESMSISFLHLAHTFRILGMYDCYGLSGKEFACNAGNTGLIPGLGRSLGDRNG